VLIIVRKRGRRRIVIVRRLTPKVLSKRQRKVNQSFDKLGGQLPRKPHPSGTEIPRSKLKNLRHPDPYTMVDMALAQDF